MRGNCNFHTSAGSPASFDRAAYGVSGKIRLNTAKGGAAGAVDEKAVESIAGAAARRGEPAIVGQATSGAEAASAGGGEGPEAVRVGPAAISLDPDTHGPAW